MAQEIPMEGASIPPNEQPRQPQPERPGFFQGGLWKALIGFFAVIGLLASVLFVLGFMWRAAMWGARGMMWDGHEERGAGEWHHDEDGRRGPGAAGGPGRIEQADEEALEEAYQELMEDLEDSHDIIADIDEGIIDLETALVEYETALLDALDILEEGEGFDAEGSVTDVEDAQETIRDARDVLDEGTEGLYEALEHLEESIEPAY